MPLFSTIDASSILPQNDVGTLMSWTSNACFNQRKDEMMRDVNLLARFYPDYIDFEVTFAKGMRDQRNPTSILIGIQKEIGKKLMQSQYKPNANL